MKNFNILGFTDFGRGGGAVMKNQYRGGDCLKRRAWTVCQFQGGAAWKETLEYGIGAQPMMVIQETLKYWVGVQQGQSYLMGRRCLFSLGWQPF